MYHTNRLARAGVARPVGCKSALGVSGSGNLLRYIRIGR